MLVIYTLVICHIFIRHLYHLDMLYFIAYYLLDSSRLRKQYRRNERLDYMLLPCVMIIIYFIKWWLLYAYIAFHRQNEKYMMWYMDTVFIIWSIDSSNIIYTLERLNCIQNEWLSWLIDGKMEKIYINVWCEKD